MLRSSKKKRQQHGHGTLQQGNSSSNSSDGQETRRPAMEGEAFSGFGIAVGDVGDGVGGGGPVDAKVLQAFRSSFVQVQRLLDQNRVLIEEINQNHESRAPGRLSRNVGLIRELNNNIRRVVGLYADLSAAFAASPGASEGGSVGGAPRRQAGQKRVRSGGLD